jgi:hypothetical protein
MFSYYFSIESSITWANYFRHNLTAVTYSEQTHKKLTARGCIHGLAIKLPPVVTAPAPLYLTSACDGGESIPAPRHGGARADPGRPPSACFGAEFDVGVDPGRSRGARRLTGSSCACEPPGLTSLFYCFSAGKWPSLPLRSYTDAVVLPLWAPSWRHILAATRDRPSSSTSVQRC